MRCPNKPIRVPTEANLECFWESVDRGLDQDCWLWEARRNHDGYGRFSIRGSDFNASRVIWFMVHRSDPGALGVLHKCDNPPCVNPSHLFLGTARDNWLDAYRKGRINTEALNRTDRVKTGRAGGLKSGRVRRARTHCPNGHLYDGGNLRIRTNGRRRCLTCHKAYCDFQRYTAKLESERR